MKKILAVFYFFSKALINMSWASTHNSFSSAVHIEMLQGQQIAPYLDAMAHMRLKMFQSAPYNYDGSIESHKACLVRYMTCEQSTTCLAWHEDTLSGFITALPLTWADEDTRLAFNTYGNTYDYMFIRNIIVRQEYQRQGICKKMEAMQSAYARQQGFAYMALATIISVHPSTVLERAHPQCVWSRLNYTQLTDAHVTYYWKERSAKDLTPHTFALWRKSLI